MTQKTTNHETPDYIEHLMQAIDTYIDFHKISTDQLMVALWEDAEDDAGWLVRGDEAALMLEDQRLPKAVAKIGDLGEIASNQPRSTARATLGKIAGGLQVLRYGSTEWNLVVHLLARQFDEPQLAQPWLAAANMKVMNEVFDGLWQGQPATVDWLQRMNGKAKVSSKKVAGSMP